MKIAPRQIASFIKNPDPNMRAVLVYGPDQGLMRERAKIIGLTVLPDLNDPFNSITLTSEQLTNDPARLNDEANAMSMLGGQRLIRITESSDSIVTFLKDYLKNPNENTLIICEAGELTPRSPLRQLFEKDENAASIACYVEDEINLSKTIATLLKEYNLTISQEALSWLAYNCSGNYQKTKQEIEKLVTFMGNEKHIEINHAQQCCGQVGEQSLDNLIYGIKNLSSEKVLRIYRSLTEEGVQVITIIRALQNHFRRLHYIKTLSLHNNSIDQAMKTLSPPVFFKQETAFKYQLQTWNIGSLENIIHRLINLEIQCKRTSTLIETLCGQAILALSQKH